MGKTFEEQLAEAARADLIKGIHDEGGFFCESRIDDYLRYRGFKAGARWHAQHTKVLVEALRGLLTFSKELCEDVGVSQHQHSIGRAEYALIEYAQGGGE